MIGCGDTAYDMTVTDSTLELKSKVTGTQCNEIVMDAYQFANTVEVEKIRMEGYVVGQHH